MATTDVEIVRSAEFLRRQAEDGVVALINGTVGPGIIPTFESVGSGSGACLGYNHGKWGLAEAPKKRSFFDRLLGLNEEPTDFLGMPTASPFALFNNPIDEEGNHVPIEIRVYEGGQGHLDQIRQFAQAYQNVIGQEARVICD